MATMRRIPKKEIGQIEQFRDEVIDFDHPEGEGQMIKITSMSRLPGRVAATFTATVGDMVLPGCALVRRSDGYGLSVPRIGAPGETRPVPLSATMEAELLRAAIAHHEEKRT
jgi:hypothetical protein